MHVAQVLLDGRQLTLAEVVRVAHREAAVDLSAAVWDRVERLDVEHDAARGACPTSCRNAAWQTTRTWRMAQRGTPLPASWVRAAVLVRLNTLLGGELRRSTLRRLLALLNADVVPLVPCDVGLAFRADARLFVELDALLSDELGAQHDVLWCGRRTSAHDALRHVDVAGQRLEARESAALLGGRYVSLGVLCLQLPCLVRLFRAAFAALCLSCEALHLRPPDELLQAYPLAGHLHGSQRLVRSFEDPSCWLPATLLRELRPWSSALHHAMNLEPEPTVDCGSSPPPSPGGAVDKAVERLQTTLLDQVCHSAARRIGLLGEPEASLQLLLCNARSWWHGTQDKVDVLLKVCDLGEHFVCLETQHAVDALRRSFGAEHRAAFALGRFGRAVWPLLGELQDLEATMQIVCTSRSYLQLMLQC